MVTLYYKGITSKVLGNKWYNVTDDYRGEKRARDQRLGNGYW